MNLVWHRMARLTVVLVLLLGLTLVGPLAASAQNGGNSDAAKECQQGGFVNWSARESGPAFTNAGECVSAAAQGDIYPAVTMTIVRVGTSDVYGNQAGTDITRCLYSVTYYNLPMPAGEYTIGNSLIDVSFYHDGALESVSGRFKLNGVATNDIVPFGVTQVIVVTDRATGEVLATGEPQVCEVPAS